MWLPGPIGTSFHGGGGAYLPEQPSLVREVGRGDQEERAEEAEEGLHLHHRGRHGGRRGGGGHDGGHGGGHDGGHRLPPQRHSLV